MMIGLRRFTEDESGATSIEYALIGSIMMIAIVASATVFSDEVEDMYLYVANNVLAVTSTS